MNTNNLSQKTTEKKSKGKPKEKKPVVNFPTKDRKVKDEVFHEYEQLLNKKTTRPKTQKKEKPKKEEQPKKKEEVVEETKNVVEEPKKEEKKAEEVKQTEEVKKEEPQPPKEQVEVKEENKPLTTLKDMISPDNGEEKKE